MRLRVKFSKHGALRFIGHLDVMRYFQKAIRRADIDIAYSEGFSPHQIMTFAAPLGVGLESNGEYMDIEVNSITSSKQLVDALNEQMAEGIEVLEARLLPDNAGNAMASVSATSYSIRFREGFKPSFLSAQSLNDFYSQQEIVVTKKTKRSETTFDMKPYIYELALDDDGETVRLTADASSAGNLKPALVMRAYYEMNGGVFDEYALLITREETYLNAGDAERPRLMPLGFIGSDY